MNRPVNITITNTTSSSLNTIKEIAQDQIVKKGRFTITKIKPLDFKKVYFEDLNDYVVNLNEFKTDAMNKLKTILNFSKDNQPTCSITLCSLEEIQKSDNPHILIFQQGENLYFVQTVSFIKYQNTTKNKKDYFHNHLTNLKFNLKDIQNIFLSKYALKDQF